tara:strand:+ start:396 stop:665 length:270 start_codon:yes stop_codon:yes gene_type:complete
MEKKVSKKNLNNFLYKKTTGFNYEYRKDNKRCDCSEFNNQKGWVFNEYLKIKKGSYARKYGKWDYKGGYGHEGFLLRECKKMVIDFLNK